MCGAADGAFSPGRDRNLGGAEDRAAYLPIDPAHPRARTDFMLADAAPVAAITTAELADRFDGHGVVVVEADDPAIGAQPSTALPTPPPDEIAHIIYTSGTTGVPKGVAVTQRNVTQLFDSLAAGVELRVGQVWTQCHSYAFDFSVWEIWGALLHGGRLVVVPDSVTRSPEDFHALLVGEQVSVLTQTPSAVTALTPQGVDAALVIGAEACRPRWWTGGRRRVMVNVYGPTETTMWASKSAPLTPGSGAPPIGSPVSGRRCSCWTGGCAGVARVVGELYVAGAGWGAGIGGGRVDRIAVCGLPVRRIGGTHVSHWGSGVLACRRAAGVSRPADEQVKIRGYRIELGEIQAALSQLEGWSRRR
ncbi:AMP-binding enzyme family protein [Mycobacterium xenopi 4042]|uniref:AMP-binding enzyme family protein n=1 Tax=Mycobacterium xenopi 4042 TaxID=1299334 RepID=X8DAN3_MYCXE|nr:AMP-binding enzyme family protein [Mycobacterium xenopi 4042]